MFLTITSRSGGLLATLVCEIESECLVELKEMFCKWVFSPNRRQLEAQQYIHIFIHSELTGIFRNIILRVKFAQYIIVEKSINFKEGAF